MAKVTDQNVTAQHVRLAIDYINQYPPTPIHDSNDYDVLVNDKRYPPRYVWGLAKQMAKESINDDSGFSKISTKDITKKINPGTARDYLDKLGFRIVPKPITLNKTIKSLLLSNLNVILTGAPGTGKTFTAKEVAKAMVGAIVPEDATEEEKSAAKTAEEKRIQSVQFHPGYDYSDFVIGMKPVLLSNDGKELEMKNGRYVIAGTDTEVVVDGETKVSFRWKDGIFKKFAKSAKEAYDEAQDRVKAPKFVFLIDEINRADLSRVFGELFSLLEEEYRYPNKPKGITLPNGENFVIPENLYIIGTMNDIDRSVESMDFALRRRFAWYEVTADQSKGIIGKKVLDEEAANKLTLAMQELNAVIGGDKKLKLKGTETDVRLGTAYQLGGAIFAKFEKCNGNFKALWNNHISNVLGEYLRGHRDRDAILKALYDIFNNAIGGVGGEQSPEQASKATTASADQQTASLT